MKNQTFLLLSVILLSVVYVIPLGINRKLLYVSFSAHSS